jgi:hypothetical protein
MYSPAPGVALVPPPVPGGDVDAVAAVVAAFSGACGGRYWQRCRSGGDRADVCSPGVLALLAAGFVHVSRPENAELHSDQ